MDELQESTKSLEVDVDAILGSSFHSTSNRLPAYIDISPKDTTWQETPLVNAERFHDEEAPTSPPSNNAAEEEDTDDDETDDDDNNDPPLRQLYIAALIMGPLLVALIVGLALLLLSLKENDKIPSNELPDNVEIFNFSQTAAPTSDSFPIIPTLFPTPFDPTQTQAPTSPKGAPATATPTAAPTSKATPAPVPVISPTSVPGSPNQPSQPPPNQAPTMSPTRKPTPSPTLTPTRKPTPSPTHASIEPPSVWDIDDALSDEQSRFFEILVDRSVTSLQVLQQGTDSESPQFRAYEWIINDPNFFDYNSDRIIQRWVLALFAFGLSSEPAATTNKQQVGPHPLETWLQYTNECTWFSTKITGRVCDNDDLYLQIHLEDTGLYGTIPTELAMLSNHIERVYLRQNHLFGTIPTEIGSMYLMERFQVTGNLLEGTLPSEIGQMTNLVVFGVGRNDLHGTLPSEFGLLENLDTIGLERNDFISTIPTEFGNMKRASILAMDYNGLFGTVPVQMEKLTLLEALNLSFNPNLEGSIPGGMCVLENLDELQADCEQNFECACCTHCY